MDRFTHLDPVDFHRRQKKDPEAVLKYYEVIKKVDPREPFILHPGHFALGCTLEYVRLDPDIGALLEGRSSWAREGLNVHSTAGIIHPGHRGIIVFELLNGGSHPIPLYPGTRVAQLLLYELEHAVVNPYGASDSEAKYLPDVATYGRPWEDWEFGHLSKELPPGFDGGED
jgi:deoxycytidine triphosphate deaminase